MKIAVAQTIPIKGDVEKNIERHRRLIGQAITKGADMIVFPELSLTGFEPELANDLATTQDDSRFQVFQQLSDTSQLIIGVGMPTKNSEGICISMIIFQPQQPRQTYSKQYLHPDEYPFFVKGQQQVFLTTNHSKIALAICYETFIPEHADNAHHNGANIYIASSLDAINKIDKDIKRLSEIAEKYKMTVLIANYAGQSGGYECAGKSAAWNNKGVLLGQLDGIHEGILLLDTVSQETTAIMV